jgi:DNA-binding CsgD family transcriptional regulator
MSKSRSLRLRDVRAIVNLCGECRELGDDRLAWRDHAIARLADLVRADMGCTGDMDGCEAGRIRDLGVTFWGRNDRLTPTAVEAHLEAFRRDPHYSPALVSYHRRNRGGAGACLTREDFLDRRAWYTSPDYELTHRRFRIDHTLWCFRSIPDAPPGENTGIILCRADGEPNFDPRDLALIREALAMIGPLVGGPLARFSDPSPRDLAPRVRQVLACLLQGDGDKQVASRLKLSPYTVNQYTKTIYRHFRVQGRSELLARWIRRGWGDRFSWAD